MTLDVAHDARHRLSDVPDARESLAFVVSLPEERISFIAYTWVDAAGRAGTALAVWGPGVGAEPIFEVVDGLDVPADQGFDDWRVGPIHVRHGEPLQAAELEFAGEAASLTYRFEALHPPYSYGSHADGCPWYLAEDRFEQAGAVRGVLRIGDREIAYDTTGHRDHSWGTRNWGAIQHWKWVWCQTGTDVAVHVMEVVGLGLRQVFGYVLKDGEMAEVTAVEDVAYALGADLMHRSYEATVHDDAGRVTTLGFAAHASFVFPVSPVCTMHEVGMTATIDGVRGPGHVEMGWPADYLRRAQSDAGVAARLGSGEAANDG
jgi:hypothetical protein